MDISPTLTDDNIPSKDNMLHNNPTAHLLQLQQKVFGNELIMRKILSKLLWQDVPCGVLHFTTKLSSAQARNIRLVSKMWSHFTTIYFEDHLMPLLSFNCFNECDYSGQRKSKFTIFMEGLVNGMSASPPPPFRLKIWIRKSFAECIDVYPFLDVLFSYKTTAYLSLVSLSIYNPRKNSFEFPLIPANLKLPFLREFIILDIGRMNLTRILREENMVIFANSVLKASLVLKQFNLDLKSPVCDDNADWNLPETLTHLKIHLKSILQILNNSPLHVLPQLRELEICKDSRFQGISGTEGIRNKIEVCMPKLDKLVLNVVSLEELEAWFDWDKWPNVKTIGLHGIPPIPPDYMARINKAFEGLVNLEFVIECCEVEEAFNLLTSGMRYIFQEMRHLRCLKLHVLNLDYTEESEWDISLTGISSPEMVRKLKQDCTLWNEFCEMDKKDEGYNTEQHQGNRLSSIRNLQQLECLYLGGNMAYQYRSNAFDDFPTSPPFISELAFQLGFLQMPKLKWLSLGFKNLQIEGIAKVWQEQVPGRSFKNVTN